jgi:hypothetical protein
MERRYRLKAALAAGVLLAVAACGGGGSDSGQAAAAGSSATGAGNGSGAAGNNGQLASDSFFAKVVAVLGLSSDTTEPGAIDSITATTPDNTEPYSIM